MLVLLAVCIGVYWFGLGATDLSGSEGHRAIPGWEIRESGDWLVTTLFAQPYARKPPGMPWAIALASTVFGPTEFAARFVSAGAWTGAILLTFAFARRWFGAASAGSRAPDDICGFASSAALALTPLFWAPGRSAEIEALNTSATHIALLLLLEALVFAPLVGRASRARALLLGAGAGMALAILLLAKGPAALPCLGAALVAACITRRALSPLMAPALGASLLTAAAIVGPAAWLIMRAVQALPETPVVQSPGEFLWDARRLPAIATLLPVSLASALPCSALLVVPWLSGRLARLGGTPPGVAGARGNEAIEAAKSDAGRAVASAAVWTVLLGLAAYTLIGVSNNRYTMPALTLCAVPAGLLWREARRWRAVPRLAGHARRTRRGLALGALALALGGMAHGIVMDHQRQRVSGRLAGEALARALDSHAIVWADHLIEARPDVLEYARRQVRGTREHGRDTIQFRWQPGLGALLERCVEASTGAPLAAGAAESANAGASVNAVASVREALPPAGRPADARADPRAHSRELPELSAMWFVLRSDPESDEARRAAALIERAELIPAGTWQVRSLTFTLYRAAPDLARRFAELGADARRP